MMTYKINVEDSNIYDDNGNLLIAIEENGNYYVECVISQHKNSDCSVFIDGHHDTLFSKKFETLQEAELFVQNVHENIVESLNQMNYVG